MQVRECELHGCDVQHICLEERPSAGVQSGISDDSHTETQELENLAHPAVEVGCQHLTDLIIRSPCLSEGTSNYPEGTGSNST